MILAFEVIDIFNQNIPDSKTKDFSMFLITFVLLNKNFGFLCYFYVVHFCLLRCAHLFSTKMIVSFFQYLFLTKTYL